jgi:chromosome segregation ATPase
MSKFSRKELEARADQLSSQIGRLHDELDADYDAYSKAQIRLESLLNKYDKLPADDESIGTLHSQIEQLRNKISDYEDRELEVDSLEFELGNIEDQLDEMDDENERRYIDGIDHFDGLEYYS